ncbi:mechanosensitive ion channel family protein [Shimia biformata]|uniref:mechanosensitive ion channel family protein n=1 Tax=Shimia biformata TaxID=1294299 RepID=UPI0019506336|nr:mechanosensitive ion channel family protein [Shimia biformata]
MLKPVLALLQLVLLSVFASAASPVDAQDTTDATELSDALKAAAEAGVSVIVIDGSGTVLAPATTVKDGKQTTTTPDEQTPSSLMMGQKRAQQFRAALLKRLEAMPASLNEVIFILRASSPDGTIITFFKVAALTLALLGLGMLVEREFWTKRLVKPQLKTSPDDAPRGYSGKLPFLANRFLLGLIGVAISVVVAFVVGGLVFGVSDDTAVDFTIVATTFAFVVTRSAALVWRMILSPYAPQYRIPHFSDGDARKLYIWLSVLALVDVSILMLTIWLRELGLNYDVYALILSLGSLLLALIYIAMVFANRRAIVNAFLGGRSQHSVSLLTRFGSRIWAPLVILYVVFAWLKLTFDLVLERPLSAPLIASAYTILTSIIVVYALVNWGIEHYFQRSREARERNDGAQAEDGRDTATDTVDTETTQGLNTFEDLARRVAGMLALVAGGFACISIWDADDVVPFALFLRETLEIVVILFIGYVAYNAFRIWIDTKIRDEAGPEQELEPGDEGGAGGASRLATLLPLFRNFILIIIVVTIALIALLELGINVSPLFAGAGVVGLAIGFGAQSLVRDIFSGAFFLIDDAFRKGEYIDVGSVKGTVENISVRSFQLRHHLGPLHTIPFGEIQQLTNYSRDWVIMKLPLRVTYDTDVEKVRKLIKKLGIELLDDPVIGHNFIQPLKSQGVIEMQDSAMIIRVKFMTKPGDQWLVRKKVYQEIRELFEREGIKFAHREVTVRLADEDTRNLDARQKEAVMAAAHAAIDEEFLDEDGDTDGDDR